MLGVGTTSSCRSQGVEGLLGNKPPPFPTSAPTHRDGLWCAKGAGARSSPGSASPATVHPRQPQKSPGLISGAALKTAQLSPREPSIARIPASSHLSEK